MQAGEIVDEIIDIIQDGSYDADAILVMVNKAMGWVASKILLPDLDMVGAVTTVTTGNVAPLPADFQRNLYRVAPRAVDAGTANKIKLYTSPGQLYWAYGSAAVDSVLWVTGAAQRGHSLLYAGIPSPAQVMDVFYYRKPVDMVSDADVPDGLPDDFHDILVSRACFMLYSRIEDGVEGPHIDTKFHSSQVDIRMDELEKFVKHGVSLPPAPIVRGEFL